MTEEQIHTDVLVIGAGLSGLSAALLLQKSGLEIVVLEAQNRVGGRTLTDEDDTFGSTDLGGGNVAPYHHPLLELANEMGVSSYRKTVKSQNLWCQNGTCFPYNNRYPRFWNPFINLDFNNAIRQLNHLMKTISVSAPWESPDADYLDSLSVDDWARENIWTRTVYGFIRYACRMDMTVTTPKQISMLYFLWFLKQFPGLICFFPSNKPQQKEKQEFKLHGGTQQISIKIASTLGDRSVHTESAVSSIEQMEDSVLVTCDNGTQYRGKYIIMAMSPALYLNVDFTPPLPDDRIASIGAMHRSCLMKSILFYRHKFWKDSDVNQVLIGTDDDKPFILSRYYLDGTRSMVTCIYSVDVNGFGQLGAKERQDLLCDHLHNALGSTEALHPVKYIEKNWAEDAYSGGGVAGTWPPGILTKYKFNFRKPYGRVYFAGSETAHKWVGQMAGAVIAGERAAKEILFDLKKISADDVGVDKDREPSLDPLPHYYNNAFITKMAPGVGDIVKLSLVGIGIGLLVGAIVYKH